MKPWDRFCEFASESTRIFKAFSMALDAKKLLFAFCGVVLWGLGAMLLNVLPNAVIPIVAGALAIVMIFVILARSETDVATKGFVLTLVGSIIAIIVVAGLLVWAGRARSEQPALLLNIYRALWTLAVAAFFGTAVCRIAAVDAATESAIGPRETMRFALKKLSTSVWTLLTPVLAVVGFGIVLMILGVIARIPAVGYVWYVIIGLLYIIALLAGLFFALTVLVYIPGLVLFQPAIGAEGNDSFDAISRAYSFVFGRPWRLLFYGIVSTVYVKIVLAVVAIIFAWAGRITNIFLAQGVGDRMADKVSALDLGDTVFQMGYSADPVGNVANGATYLRATVGAPLFGPFLNSGRHILGGNVLTSFGKAGHPGGWFIIFWQYILLSIFMAFAVCLLYSVFTQIYFLMRKACDGTPFEEVYIETPEEEEYEAEFPAEGAEEGAAGGEEEKPKAPKARKKRSRKKKDVPEEPIDLAGEEEKPEESDK
jgi:hypothetical protein